MKIRLSLITVALFFVISSCQKDLTTEDQPNSTPLSTDSTLLKTYIILDSIGGIDTLVKTTFEYDSQMRLTMMKTKVYRDSTFQTRHYTYNSNDTLVSKVLELYYGKDLNNYFYDSVFFYFNRNINNQITKDSLNGYYSYNNSALTNSKRVSDFTYFGDSIYRVIKQYTPLPSILAEHSYKQIKLNGNIIQEREDPIGNTENRIAIISYDNKRNPVSVEKINYPVHFSPNNFEFGDIPSNNVLTSNTNGYIVNYTYVYNNFGLPKSAIITYPIFPGNPINVDKAIYIYGN